MAVAKKTRLLTQSERKTLKERIYSYVNFLDGLLDKNINPQILSDLKKYKLDIKSACSRLSKF